MTPDDQPPRHPSPAEPRDPAAPHQPGAPREPAELRGTPEPSEVVQPHKVLLPREPDEPGAVVAAPHSVAPGDTLWSRDPGGPREAVDARLAGDAAISDRRCGGARRAAVLGTALLLIVLVGIGLGVAVALPGLLPGPPAAPGSAQPSYVIDTQSTPAPTPAAAVPVASPMPLEYTVQDGDTLRSIADKLYGDAGLWPTLYEANRDTIGPDPDTLRVGMRLQAPAR